MKASEIRIVYIQASAGEIGTKVNAWLEEHSDTDITKIKPIASEDGLDGILIFYQPQKTTRSVGFTR